MSRELKRVPLDFNWPLHEVWEGYVNPHGASAKTCRPCEGSGSAPQALLFSKQWYGNAPFDPVAYGAKPLTIDHPGVQAVAKRNVERSPEYFGITSVSALFSGKAVELVQERAVAREAKRLWNLWKDDWGHHLIQADVDALVAADRLWDFTRTPVNDEQREIVRKKIEDGGNSWLPESNGYTPTADEVNAWSLYGIGHDAINQWVCVKARCEREGVTYRCALCHGEGTIWPTPEAKKAFDEWTDKEPPEGPGYQLWEDVTEGSPVSPVFETLDQLCEWAETNATTFGSNKTSAAEWRKMLGDGLVYHREGNGIFL